MNNNDNYMQDIRSGYDAAKTAPTDTAAATNTRTISAYNLFLNKVFGWMFVGLAVSGGTAYWVSLSETMIEQIYGTNLYWGIFFGTLILVVGLTAAINRINSFMATLGFLTFSVLMGLLLSYIYVVYSEAMLATAFLISAGMFGGMALFGFVTRRDLTILGRICFMALLGLLIAIGISIFMPNPMATFVISILGVIIFCALTAYDLQKIRQFAEQIDDPQAQGEIVHKGAIIGALTLYLDFVNIFIFILRLFGGGRR